MMLVLPILIFGLVFGSIYLLSWEFYPVGSAGVKSYHQKKVAESAQAIDDMFMSVPTQKRLHLIHLFTPLALGAATSIIFKGNWPLIFSAMGVGVILPTLILRQKQVRRREKFRLQLVDALTIMMSCLKGGLGFLQALEVLEEEMPSPVSEEFGLMLREHRMGVSLDDALKRLSKRMPSHELNLITTAILFSRETGGDIATVFAKLADSFRETVKIKEKVKTLTTQGRLQGIIMSLLPILFTVLVYSTQPDYFDVMFTHPVGRILLGVAVVLQIVGSFLIWHLSKVDF